MAHEVPGLGHVVKKDRQIGSAGGRLAAGGLIRSPSQTSLSGFSDGSYEDLEGSVTFDYAAELQLAKDVGRSKESSRRVKSASSVSNSSKAELRAGLHGSLEDWLLPTEANQEQLSNVEMPQSPSWSSAPDSPDSRLQENHAPARQEEEDEYPAETHGDTDDLQREDIGAHPWGGYINMNASWSQERPASRGVDPGNGLGGSVGLHPGMMFGGEGYEDGEYEEGDGSPAGVGLSGMWDHTMDFGPSMVNTMGLLPEELTGQEGGYMPGLYGPDEQLMHMGRQYLSSIAEEESEEEGSGASPKSPGRRSSMQSPEGDEMMTAVAEDEGEENGDKENEEKDQEDSSPERPLSAGSACTAGGASVAAASTKTQSSVGRVLGELLDEFEDSMELGSEPEDPGSPVRREQVVSFQATAPPDTEATPPVAVRPDNSFTCASSVGRIVGELVDEAEDAASEGPGSVVGSPTKHQQSRLSMSYPESIASCSSVGRTVGEVLDDVLDGLSASGSLSIPGADDLRQSTQSIASTTTSTGRAVGEVLNDVLDDLSASGSLSMPPGILYEGGSEASMVLPVADSLEPAESTSTQVAASVANDDLSTSASTTTTTVTKAVAEVINDMADDLSASASTTTTVTKAVAEVINDMADDLSASASTTTTVTKAVAEVINDMADDLSASASTTTTVTKAVAEVINEIADNISTAEPAPALSSADRSASEAADPAAAASTEMNVDNKDAQTAPTPAKEHIVPRQNVPVAVVPPNEEEEEVVQAQTESDAAAVWQAALEARLKELEAENEKLRHQVLESQKVSEEIAKEPARPAAPQPKPPSYSSALVPTLSQTRESQPLSPGVKYGKTKFPLTMVVSPTPPSALTAELESWDSEESVVQQAVEVVPSHIPVTPMSDRKASSRGYGRPPRPGSSSGLKPPLHPPQLIPLASGSWMSGAPGAGGRVYNVTADDVGGETSDPQIWPPPRGGPKSHPSGSAALMEARSYNGPHVGNMVGSDRRHSQQAPSTSFTEWTHAFELGEKLIEDGNSVYRPSSPPRQPHSAIDAEMQEILGHAWLGTVDDEQGLGAERSVQSQMGEVLSAPYIGTQSNRQRSRSASNVATEEEVRRQQLVNKWVNKIPKGRRPNPKSAKDLTWHFCRPTTASAGAASSVAAPPRSVMQSHSKDLSTAAKARPATAPQYALGGGGGNMAAFSRRFFSAEAMATRPKSPPRCPSSQSRQRPTSRVRRYSSARTSRDSPSYEVSSRVSQDLQRLSNKQPQTSTSAMETALSYLSREAPSNMWATKLNRPASRELKSSSQQLQYRPASQQAPRRKPLSGRSLLMARPATADEPQTRTGQRGSRSSLGLKGTTDPWKRGPESGAWSGSSRQSIGYLYHRQSGNFSVVPIPEKIGPPVPTVEVDLGDRIAEVPEKAFWNIQKIIDRMVDQVVYTEIPKRARVGAHHAMAEVMHRVDGHIDATFLVPGILNDIVHGAVERSDSKTLAKEILIQVFANVNSHALRGDSVKDLLDESVLVTDNDLPVMKEDEWRAIQPSQEVIERVASPWKLKQLRAAEEAARRPPSPPSSFVSPRSRGLVSFQGEPSDGSVGPPPGCPPASVAAAAAKKGKAPAHQPPERHGNGSWRESRPVPISVPADPMKGADPVNMPAGNRHVETDQVHDEPKLHAVPETTGTEQAKNSSDDAPPGAVDLVAPPEDQGLAQAQGPPRNDSAPVQDADTANPAADDASGGAVSSEGSVVPELSLQGIASTAHEPSLASMAPCPPAEAPRASSGRQRPTAARRGRGRSLTSEASADFGQPTKPPAEAAEDSHAAARANRLAAAPRRPSTPPPKPTADMHPILHAGVHEGTLDTTGAEPDAPLPSWSSEVRAADSQDPIMRKYANMQWPESPKRVPSQGSLGVPEQHGPAERRSPSPPRRSPSPPRRTPVPKSSAAPASAGLTDGYKAATAARAQQQQQASLGSYYTSAADQRMSMGLAVLSLSGSSTPRMPSRDGAASAANPSLNNASNSLLTAYAAAANVNMQAKIEGMGYTAVQ